MTLNSDHKKYIYNNEEGESVEIKWNGEILLVGGSGGERSESIDKGFRAAAHSLICNKATANGQRLHYFSPIMPTLTSRSPISCTPTVMSN